MIINANDISRMKEKILGFPEQIKKSWKNGKVPLTSLYRNPSQILVCGMGGSAIAGDLLSDLLFSDSMFPVLVNRGYELPGFVNERSLLLISSYSGNTEETIAAMREGIEKKAMIIVFTSNGTIEKMAREHGLPAITFPQGYPPRSALGFSFFSMLGFLKQCFDIPVEDTAIDDLIELLTSLRATLQQDNNEIAILAEQLKESIPLVYISTLLRSVAFRWQTQINENSKTFVHVNVLPEANHNEIVGLQFPYKLVKKMHLMFLRAPLFENREMDKRFEITAHILKNAVGNITTICAEGKSKLEQLFTLLYKGDFLSFYLSALLNVDPTPVKRIDELKTKLKQ